MPLLYGGADAFVLPTRGEGWGLPILEAMAAGVPAIATNWSGPVRLSSVSENEPLFSLTTLCLFAV
jgi:glycosyltransferase involved in cell wall biosynthesis